ncbi:endolytic transglycosylase MltG [Leptothrix discophora]|uniref:Endolytic murein transglycosylase n=1 Tax=Leptothrix discophora TaxID=89 RepID=A0ABT9FZA5_LEPDI|nr:endolytic transglycosylase MltG [Leptothrix discophora]MDP4299562.1 endolytic transglycosylase MltG [Leptothrix discophora]
MSRRHPPRPGGSSGRTQPPAPRRSRPAAPRGRRWLGLLLLTVLLVAAMGAAAGLWLYRPLALAQEPVELTVEPGDSPRDIARRLVDAGVQSEPRWLFEYIRWSGQSRAIKAGSYEFGAGTRPVDMLRKLVDGDVTLARVRLIEGWTFRQWRAELARHPDLKQEAAALDDAALMASIGAPGLAPEGRFYPDTYAYSKGSSDLAVLRRALHAMQRHLDNAWLGRVDGLPLKSPDEALTLASIVEKETGRASDRPQIAGVFINRLRIGMPLQTDPSVIYGLGERFDGNLRRRDLEADTPFNTYTRGGLPPTPIAMPGRDALIAATRPATTNALYFVARGDGSSEFSSNLADHNRAVDRYQRRGVRP